MLNYEFVDLSVSCLQQTDCWCYLILCGWHSHHEVPLQSDWNGHHSQQETLVCTPTSSQGSVITSHVEYVFQLCVGIMSQKV